MSPVHQKTLTSIADGKTYWYRARAVRGKLKSANTAVASIVVNLKTLRFDWATNNCLYAMCFNGSKMTIVGGSSWTSNDGSKWSEGNSALTFSFLPTRIVLAASAKGRWSCQANRHPDWAIEAHRRRKIKLPRCPELALWRLVEGRQSPRVRRANLRPKPAFCLSNPDRAGAA